MDSIDEFPGAKHLLTSEEKLLAWGIGEWVEEADEYEFSFEGYECKVLRISSPEAGTLSLGHLCGYVTIPANHPWFEKHYDEIECDVYGGLTYSGLEEDSTYQIGFDCSHSMDVTPGIERWLSECRSAMGLYRHDRTYKNMNFVVEELKSLVKQAEAMCAK